MCGQTESCPKSTLWVSFSTSIYMYQSIVQSNVHFFFFGCSGGSSAAKIASSKTFFRPFCVNAEHSTYLTALSSRACFLQIQQWWVFACSWLASLLLKHHHASRLGYQQVKTASSDSDGLFLEPTEMEENLLLVSVERKDFSRTFLNSVQKWTLSLCLF